MKKQIITSVLYTVITAVLLGIVYPICVTGIAQFAMRQKANGQLIGGSHAVIGSALIGQPFTGSGYFHSRPSAAGAGYDASSSSGSNLGPTSKALADRVNASVRAELGSGVVPVDLVTASGSGLDPDISPAAAMYQVQRVSERRHMSRLQLEQLVSRSVTPRQFGLLGEPRVNLLNLNLALDRIHPMDSR